MLIVFSDPETELDETPVVGNIEEVKDPWMLVKTLEVARDSPDELFGVSETVRLWLEDPWLVIKTDDDERDSMTEVKL